MPIGMRVAVDISGITGLVSEAKQRNITLKAVRAGIKILQPIAKANAPRRKGSGALRQSQGTKAAKGKRGQTVAYAVQGAKTKFQKMVKLPGYRQPVKVVPAFYDHLVQGGTKPHKLRGGQHPGAKANPYRRRAYESVKSQIGAKMNEVMGIEVQKAIEKQAAKLAAKGAK